MSKEAIPVLDELQVADLMALDQGRGAIYGQFVKAFVAVAQSRFDLLARHAESGDGAALAAGAHSLAGSAGNIGASRLAALLGEIEAVGKGGDLAGAGELVSRLAAEYALARDAMLIAANPTLG